MEIIAMSPIVGVEGGSHAAALDYADDPYRGDKP
jgi:hypothetical protein